MEQSKQPLVAIVGSMDKTRTDELGLSNIEAAKNAAEQLGAALAERGYGLIVYSRDPQFIEGDFVRGYASSPKAKEGSIQVRYDMVKNGQQLPRFEQETGETKKLFVDQPHPVGGWAVPFYKSLTEAAGIILMGGGRSAFTAGLIALSIKIPVIAVGTFGGQTRKLCELLPSSDHPVSAEDWQAMIRDHWDDNASADNLIEALDRQRQKLRQEALEDANQVKRRRSSTVHRAWAGGIGLILAITLTSFAVFTENPPSLLLGSLLFIIPLLGGGAGAMAHAILDLVHAPTNHRAYHAVVAFFLGAVAGLVPALALVLSHVSTGTTFTTFTDPNTIGTLQKLMLFNLVISIVSGVTWESIFGRIQKTDVGHHMDMLGPPSQ